MKPNSKILEFATNLPDDYLREKLLNDSERVAGLTLSACGIRVDFSKQLWDLQVINELISYINSEGVIESKIEALFRGDKINSSEQRAVKHYLLRAHSGSYPDPDQATVLSERERFLQFAEQIFLDSKIKNIVNIGIGGSDLGPRMIHRALSGAKKKIFFVSNIDKSDLIDVLNIINFEETIFVVVSKTFTTDETMRNAQRAKIEFLKQMPESEFSNHFVAVSTNLELAKEFGIKEDRVFGFWDWVGGRYSLASAAGISIPMAYGRAIFEELLSGMHDFDKHFRQTPIRENLAFWHALSWFYNLNYLNCKNIAVIGYASALQHFATYLQQLVMESNGKSVDLENQPTNSIASPVIFGEVGTNSQHSFFQLIHQGPDIIPVDFILIKPNPESAEDVALSANALAQASVLAMGTDPQQKVALEKRMPGNRPSNLLILNSFDGYTLGALISLYEASTIIQGFINNINSFDQWGVQLGKTVAKDIEASLRSGKLENLDYSTKAAIEFLS